MRLVCKMEVYNSRSGACTLTPVVLALYGSRCIMKIERDVRMVLSFGGADLTETLL